MRNVTRFVLATVLAATLAVPAFAAEPARNRERRGVDIVQMVKKMMKRFFGVSAQGETMTLPHPTSVAPPTSN